MDIRQPQLAIGKWLSLFTCTAFGLPGCHTLTLMTIKPQCRQNAAGVLARVAAFLELDPQPTAAQLEAAADVRANRGHDMRSSVPGCSPSAFTVWQSHNILHRGRIRRG